MASRFVVNNGRVTFELAKYDTNKEVAIDPTVVFVSYLGGTFNDSVTGVAIVNPTLSFASPPSFYFVTGTTSSPNFPTTAGVLPTCTGQNVPVGCDPNGLTGTTLSGAQNVFVTKISFSGTTILWSTYLGGNSRDGAAGIAVDISNTANANCSAGCPVIVGQTFSANFPTLPFQGTNGAPGLQGSNDGFAAKLNSTGTGLVYSTYLGGIADDQATGVAINIAGAPLGAGNAGDVFVGGYTDSPLFLGLANHGIPTTSSDTFVVKIPVSYGATSNFSTLTGANNVALYGGFGEEFARGIAYNSSNGMVYVAGDTTTGAQNFISPNNKNLPGITNNTVNAYTVGGVTTGLPGPTGIARDGFVIAFDASTLIQTFGSYVAVSPANTPNYESITGIAAEGGTAATGCTGSSSTGTCTKTSTATATIAATYGNAGHMYITGNTTSATASASIAKIVPTTSCASPIIASSTATGTQITGPNGVQILTPGGFTQAGGCVTALITQAPFNTNQAVTTGCTYPIPTPLPAGCNLSAFVAILDGALLTVPGALPAPIGNQIEYWAYYSSANASTTSNAIAIDTNPTTLSSTYSLGTYQQMYITGASQLTTAAATTCLAGQAATSQLNCLPMTNVFTANPAPGTTNTSTYLAPSEIFTSYNVGTTTGGGVGGFDPFPNPDAMGATVGNLNEIDAYVARFNANGLAASSYGGQGSAMSGVANNMGYGTNQVTPPQDHSFLIHTPQFNFGEYLYETSTQDGSSTPNTVGNAIAVDPTRAALVGGATNVSNNPGTKNCVPLSVCNFATTNAVLATNSGGNDGWVSVLFFNDILSNAGAQASANPFLTPTAPLLTTNANTTVTGITGCALAGNCSYIEDTPAPFGPTFDFAISDPSTQTQTFQVLFTGQASGQLAGTTPWFIPADIRSGATTPILDNNEPGSGIAYYVPCTNPTATFTGATAGSYNNAYPAPGGPYSPMTCAFPINHLYEGLPILFSGYPGLPFNGGLPNGTVITPGWLVVSQDVAPGVVRMQLDRRAAAGLLEGTYVGQFLVTTLDPNSGYPGHAATQWPPCGPQSALNPFVTTPICTAASTPLPADNVSILVTVRLVVRPSLFLSRNSGLLTGVTSSLAANPMYGPNIGNNTQAQTACNANAPAILAITCPATDVVVQQGTGRVPDWYYVGGPGGGGSALHGNDIDTWPVASNAACPGSTCFGLGSLFGAGNGGVNSGPGVCLSGTVAGVFVPNLFNLPPMIGQIGNFATATPNLLIPCPVFSTTLQDTWGTSANALAEGSAAYLGNGPGDVPAAAGHTPASTPTMTFLYDVGTVLSISGGPASACGKLAGDPTNTLTNECNLSIQQNLAPFRPDQPFGVMTYNADWQGGQDPLTQRNDATVHDYYVTAEGQATISVTAVNCTGWNPTTGHNNLVGNWLAVEMGGVSVSSSGAPNPATYTPICSDESPTTVGTHRALATGCPESACSYTLGAAVIGDDTALPGAVGGQQIQLDFLAKAFSGGCLSQAADSTHNATTCVTNAGNAGPRETYNGIPTGLYTATVYVWSTRAKNVVPGYCLGASMPSSSLITGADPTPLCTTSTAAASTANPNPEVIVTGQQMFNVSLFVFDTTQVIQITPNACPVNGILPGQTIPLTDSVANPENLFTGNVEPPYGTGSSPNYPNFGPQVTAPDTVVWSLVPWTPTTPGLLSCALPNGGSSVPNVGTINNTGPISETSFTAAPSFLNTAPSAVVTFYTCRPAVAPSFLSQSQFTEDPVKYPPYPAAFQGVVAPAPSLASQICTINPTGSSTGVVMSGSRVGVLRGTTFNFDSNGNGIGPAPADANDRADNFLPPSGNQAGDIGVIGDWNGDGHSKAGWFRPSTGEWWLDFNDSGTFTAGVSLHYTGFGQTGDVPVVGDWAGLGKACVGVVRAGFLWIEDLNCNGVFDAPGGTPTTGDAVFAYGSAGAGGLPADTPVVGNWFGQINATTGKSISQAGGVRPFAAAGGPALWLLDGGIGGTVAVAGTVTSATPTGTPATSCSATIACTGVPAAQASHGPANFAGNGSPTGLAGRAGTAFGGSPGDIPVVGDWYNTGVSQFGDFAQGFLWVLDGAAPTSPQASQFDGFVFPYGGLSIDKPIVGKW